MLNIRESKRKESNVGEDNHRRNESRENNQQGNFTKKIDMCISITNNLISEIAELRLAVSNLTREVRELHHEKKASRTRTQHSLSPSLLPTNYSKV